MIAKKTSVAFLVSAFIAGGAFAATDGELGEDSTGTLEITLSVGNENDGDGSILIQKLEDLNLGEFDASNANALGAVSNFCVYRTGSPDGFDFNIEATSANGTGNTAFELLSITTSETIGYSVHYSENIGATDNSPKLSYGKTNPVKAATSVGLTDDGDGAFSCNGENVSLYIKASVEDASVATAATDYKDTLTLVVTPI